MSCLNPNSPARRSLLLLLALLSAAASQMVAAHAVNDAPATCTDAARPIPSTVASGIELEIRCPGPRSIVIAMAARSAFAEAEIFLDPQHEAALDRPMHFRWQPDEGLTAAQRRHTGIAAAEISDDGRRLHWTIRLPEEIGTTIIGLGIDARAGDVGIAWPRTQGKATNRRRLGDLYIGVGPSDLSTVAGRTAWESTDGLPPARIVARSESGRVETGTVDGSGRFTLRLPPGSYALRAMDPRMGAGSERTIDLGPGETLHVDESIDASRAMPPLQSLIERTMAEHDVNGAAIAWVDGGTLRFSRTFGAQNDGDPADAETLFGLESVTKAVTALTVLRMASAGDWDLDEPLSDHWIDPDLQSDPRHGALTARLVLRHQSGLPNWRGDERLAFISDPGARQTYSGEAFEYLRRAIERSTGRGLDDLARQYVFEPANMTDTHFLWSEEMPERIAGFHYGEYAFDDFDQREDEASAASDLWSTASDLGRLGLWLAEGAGLPRTYWEDILTPSAAALVDPDDRLRMGLGLMIFDRPGEGDLPLFGHGGTSMGARTFLLVDPNTQSAVAVATSSAGGVPLVRAVVEATLKSGRSLPLVETELREWGQADY